jgi:hypothetical protein
MYFAQFVISDPELEQLVFLSLFNQFSWIADLCTIAVPAWLLLWASDSMRRHIIEIFLKLFNRNTQVSFNSEHGNIEGTTNGPRIAWEK